MISDSYFLIHKKILLFMQPPMSDSRKGNKFLDKLETMKENPIHRILHPNFLFDATDNNGKIVETVAVTDANPAREVNLA